MEEGDCADANLGGGGFNKMRGKGREDEGETEGGGELSPSVVVGPQ